MKLELKEVPPSIYELAIEHDALLSKDCEARCEHHQQTTGERARAGEGLPEDWRALHVALETNESLQRWLAELIGETVGRLSVPKFGPASLVPLYLRSVAIGFHIAKTLMESKESDALSSLGNGDMVN